MKCSNSVWNAEIISAFNAQGSTGIIVVAVQVGAVKIHVTAVEPLRKKERWVGFTCTVGTMSKDHVTSLI